MSQYLICNLRYNEIAIDYRRRRVFLVLQQAFGKSRQSDFGMLHVVFDHPKLSEWCSLLLMIPEILLLVEQIRPRTSQIYNLGAAISVLFETCAFEAVKGVGNSLKDICQRHVKGATSQGGTALPRHHRQRICSGSFQKSIRRRCGRGLLGGRNCRRRGTCRRICRRGGRWRCRRSCDT